MTNKPPPIDSRTAADIVKQVQELLLKSATDATSLPNWQGYAPDWQEFDAATGKPKGISAALIGVFARYAEIIIQRLNQVPNKNFLAFLNLLGASQLPPQPARVPLLFSLAVGSEVDATVPAGTQVAAPSAEGDEEPVIFETERDLVVTAATLEAVFVRDSEQDKYADYSEIAKIPTTDTTTSILEAPIFRGKQPVEHILKIGHRKILGFPKTQNSTLSVNLTLTISLSKSLGDNAQVQWQMWDGEKWQDREPTEARLGAKNLGLQGDNQLTFAAMTSVFATSETASEIGWLRCVLKSAIAPVPNSQAPPLSGKVRSTELPKINAIEFALSITRSSLVVEEAFINQLPIDLSKQFFPFGEQPKFSDTFYLANQEAFSKSGATVTLEIDLIDPLLFLGLERETINKFKENQNPQLKWEVWDGQTQKWRAIGTSRRDGSNPDELATAFQDSTNAFTNVGENLQITFTLQPSFIPQLTTVNGIENFWIRVRIIAGDYGKGARYQEVPGRYELIPASFVPPAIEYLRVGYTLNTPEFALEKIITYNDFNEQEIKLADNGTFAPFEPFGAIADDKPTLYLGFSLPIDRHFANSPLSLFFRVADTKYTPNFEAVAKQDLGTNKRLHLSWQYWNGKEWINLTVRDDSENFTRSGLVDVLPPSNIAPREDFGLPERYWLSVRWESGNYDIEPRLRRILLNTTIASQTVTISNEILGSSNGAENLVFCTTRSPVLDGEYLEVREPEIPSALEQDRIKNVHGEDAISVIPDINEQPQAIWVRWQQVTDFYASNPRDRHYVLDRITGEIRFGDGLNGLIPPIGIGNLRLRKYQTGGGTIGNQPANTIVQLKTTVPYIDSVTNPEAATGGADAETIESLTERSPRTVRHSNRAVTFEDYEDLAMLATPEVARAKCVPLLNLHANPLDVNKSDQPPKAPGEVSVIIVPRSLDKKPLPTLNLLARVQDYLETHAIATTKIWVVGPLYVEVSVIADIALTSPDGASTVKQAVNKTLTDFLHPLTGGLDGNGWTFGRRPHRSDFYALLEAVPGVDHIRSLKIEKIGEQNNVEKIQDTGRFLVYSGIHTINLWLEEV
ncbi:putative baseplate assembly protein [Floridanema aerugineum]|uniref:Baseplate assembly protein n=1 Tax=Floridaenema aerugineum BLCC-F46 TaxID=3153654 RepID=A0ABV4WXZ4_9CYAN